MTNAKCIIVAAGDFSGMDLNYQDADLLIACDAGFRYVEEMGILPDLIIGDFDSAKEAGGDLAKTISAIEGKWPEKVIRLPVEKDDTDTMAAVKEGLQRGYHTFTLYGMLGGRRFDHSIANLQTLLYLQEHGARGQIISEDMVCLIARDETIHFSRGSRGGLSVFAVNGSAIGVTIKGFYYEAENVTLKEGYPLGVSNSFLEDQEGSVSVKKGTLLIMVAPSEASH